jgi:hypothetical protein
VNEGVKNAHSEDETATATTRNASLRRGVVRPITSQKERFQGAQGNVLVIRPYPKNMRLDEDCG